MTPISPTVARWELFERLRRRQTELGITGPTIAKRLGYATTYWPKIEKEQRVLTEEKLKLLIELLELDGEEQDELLSLRAIAKGRGWWDEYAGLFNEQQMRLWGLEYGAEEISTFESLLIPGLLQTEDYARHLITSDSVFIRKPEVRQRVAARMRRQERLDEPDALRLAAVVSEAALHQQIGNPVILREQLQHLIGVINSHSDTLDIRILPYTSPSGAILGGAGFHILDFPGPKVSPLAWHESAVVGEVIEDPTQIDNLTTVFGHAQSQALDQQESLALIEQAAAELGSAS
ncbi:DUF5753 domain-containing protein [Nocardia sp. CA-107356]|uniref:DUF5753 domain-containing protein n=1 Tax=Nocardia sp. CA-107356 TaxID=3239972 RepID=UPI003D8D9C1D